VEPRATRGQDRRDFGLNRYWRRRVLAELGPGSLDGIVDRFAVPYNAAPSRFNALFDAPDLEAAEAFAEDWRSSWSYLIPPFTKLDALLDKLERDNAATALVVPVWKSRGWWRRLASGAWADRIDARRAFPPTALSAHRRTPNPASSGRPSLPRSSPSASCPSSPESRSRRARTPPTCTHTHTTPRTHIYHGLMSSN